MTEFRDMIGSIVGRNIAVRRRQLGISEEQFCKCLGVESDVLHSYESGEVRVDAKSLLSIGTILDVSPMYFFTNLEHDRAANSVSKAPESDVEVDRQLFLKEGVALNHAFARIGKSKSRQILIDIAIALADIDRVPNAAGLGPTGRAGLFRASRSHLKPA